MSKIICHVTHGGGQGVRHQLTHGGEGSKIGQKGVTYYLNGPLNHCTLIYDIERDVIHFWTPSII
jgi:hypothetical protein